VVQVGAVTVVNPGRIGMLAYTDDNPASHVIATGTPRARYAAATRRPGGKWSVDLRAVVYDWDRAAQQARENGKPIMAHWTSTGRVREMQG
jgi:hypothetical protein